MTDSMPAPPPHRTMSPGLLGTLRGFLYAVAAAGLGAALTTVNEARRFGEFLDGVPGSLGRLADAEEASQGLAGVFGLCALVIAILSIIWWYQAYQAIDRTGSTGRSWSAGWAIGGWFIPFANFIIPKLVLDEIDRVSGAAEEGSASWAARPRLRQAAWWWWTFVAASITLGAGNVVVTDQIERGITDADLYRQFLWVSSAGFVLYVAAALFAAAALRILGGRLVRLPGTGRVRP